MMKYLIVSLIKYHFRSVYTPFAGLVTNGLSPSTVFKAEDKKAFIVWGAGSSIGSRAVQIAKSRGFTVYATSSARHHSNLIAMGASKVFDYSDADVVDKIVNSVKEGDVSLEYGTSINYQCFAIHGHS
jgi:NADPH:quinone reductase-like Zn-dependent oxidoreductase